MTTTTTPTTPPRTHPGTRRWRRPAAGALAGLVGALGIGLPSLTAPAGAATISDLNAAVTVSTDEVEAALARLRADAMLAEPADLSASTSARVPALATKFGLAFFQGLVQGTTGGGLEFALAHLGFMPGQEGEALQEIRTAIDQLNADVQAVSRQIEAVLEGQDRINFYNSYTASGQAASRLSVALASANAWIAAGANPSEANVSDLQTVVRTSVADLAFQVANPTTGTIPLMMRAAEPANVSDLRSYWQAIDTARDDYRAVLAQGLATLELLERWDTTGTVAADLDALTPVAKDTVWATYKYGIEAKTPAGTAAVYLRGQRGGLAPAQTQSGSDGLMPLWTLGDVGLSEQRFFEGLARDYRPEHHGGVSLEQWLRSRGLPTAIVDPKSVETNVTHRNTTNQFVREVVHRERVQRTQVVGNTVTTGWIDLGVERVAWSEAKKYTHEGLTWFLHLGDPDAAEALAQAERDAWRAAMVDRTARWTEVSDAHARVMRLVTYPLNPGGFASDIVPERVWAAAFG